MRPLLTGTLAAAALGGALFCGIGAAEAAPAGLARPGVAGDGPATQVRWRGGHHFGGHHFGGRHFGGPRFGGWRGGPRWYGARFGHRWHGRPWYGPRRYGWGYDGYGPGYGFPLGFVGGALAGAALAAPAPAPAYGPSPAYIAYCAKRYRSFDPATGTYLGYDGVRHVCR